MSKKFLIAALAGTTLTLAACGKADDAADKAKVNANETSETVKAKAVEIKTDAEVAAERTARELSEQADNMQASTEKNIERLKDEGRMAADEAERLKAAAEDKAKAMKAAGEEMVEEVKKDLKKGE